MIKLEDIGTIDLLFSDETGFSLEPYIPYGWQPIGEQISIRSAKDRVCNAYGLLSRNGSLQVWTTPQNINSDFIIPVHITVMAQISEILNQIISKAIVIIDHQ